MHLSQKPSNNRLGSRSQTSSLQKDRDLDHAHVISRDHTRDRGSTHALSSGARGKLRGVSPGAAARPLERTRVMRTIARGECHGPRRPGARGMNVPRNWLAGHDSPLSPPMTPPLCEGTTAPTGGLTKQMHHVVRSKWVWWRTWVVIVICLTKQTRHVTCQCGYGGVPGYRADPVSGYQMFSSYFYVSQV